MSVRTNYYIPYHESIHTATTANSQLKVAAVNRQETLVEHRAAEARERKMLWHYLATQLPRLGRSVGELTALQRFGLNIPLTALQPLQHSVHGISASLFAGYAHGGL